ncbi:MAG: YbaB/EbfC family nucleoid-associated protein [Puniceicoccales bacterium]|jgi:DNA-binding protein YbaB|nr:YbaB/EbfC family nucleoid-associated protein [Puniceicoccales bacterium]
MHKIWNFFRHKESIISGDAPEADIKQNEGGENRTINQSADPRRMDREATEGMHGGTAPLDSRSVINAGASSSVNIQSPSATNAGDGDEVGGGMLAMENLLQDMQSMKAGMDSMQAELQMYAIEHAEAGVSLKVLGSGLIQNLSFPIGTPPHVVEAVINSANAKVKEFIAQKMGEIIPPSLCSGQ